MMKKSPRFSKLRVENLEQRTLLAVVAGGEQFFKELISLEEPVCSVGISICENQSPGTTSSSVADIDITNLNSKPDSIYTIYLDFDGNTTTTWTNNVNKGASIVTPRFTIDGDTSKTSFTDAEQAAIYQIWQGVAEDFLPFDVNVTTVEPSQSDFLEGRAQRIAIGGSNTDWLTVSASTTTGIARMDSFKANADIPCFAFSESYVNSNRTGIDAASLAATVSHEVGHTLGLSHQGYYDNGSKYEYFEGANDWGPIMGNPGGCNLNPTHLTQWSQGDYESATNTEDELEIITTQNGFGYRADDYADSFSGATVLAIAGGEGEVSGIIERNTDIDFFVFESDGSELQFRIGGIKNVTNLDVLVTVYGSNHQILFVCDPSDRLDAEFVFSEKAGTYYLSVEGTGLETDWPGIYSDYGSLGAYTVSVGYPNTLVVTTLADTVSNDGFLSLREAVLLASEKCSTIVFDNSLSNGTIYLTAGQIELDCPVVIDASGIGGITIDAQSSSRIFMVNGTAVLRSLTITGGKCTESDGGLYTNYAYGGGIFNSGSLTLVNCLISDNLSVYTGDGWGCSYGGGIYNDEGSRLMLTGCAVSGNSVSGDSSSGGGIYSIGTLTMTDCIVSGNISRSGGGIYGGEGGTLTLTGCAISENTARTCGGIYNDSGVAALTNCTIRSNTAERHGGGICNCGMLTLTNSTVSENTARYGGGVYSEAGDLTLTDCAVSGNSVTGDFCHGGGIYNKSGIAALTNCAVSGNTANGNGDYYNSGGGIYNSGSSAELILTNSTVSGNTAGGKYGIGGGICNSDGTSALYNTVIARNTATYNGNDVYSSSGFISAYNTLSSFTGWDESSHCLAYDPSLPLFADASNGDYILAENSQAIDKGNNEYIAGYDTDLAGNLRIVNGIVDLGAYEFGSSEPLPAPTITTGNRGIYVSCGANGHQIVWSEVENNSGYELAYSTDGGTWTTVSVSGTSTIITGLTYGQNVKYRVRALGGGVSYADSDWSAVKVFKVCPMDVDGDGDITGGDRALLASSWLSEEGEEEYLSAADIDGDGNVSGGDRAFLSSNWLMDPEEEGLQYPAPLAAEVIFAEFASADLAVDLDMF